MKQSAHDDPSLYAKTLAFRLPNGAFGQSDIQLIKGKSAPPEMRCVIKAGWCRDNDTIDTLGSPFQTSTTNPDIGCQLVSRSAIPKLASQVKRWNMQMRLWMATRAFAVPNRKHHSFGIKDAIQI